MSIKATSWVWSLEGESDENPHGLPNGTIKLVLMKHADHAHDDGTHTWQSVETVAKYALCSKRTAQRANEWLIENGYMREGDQSVIPDHYDPRRRPIAYELAMSEETRALWAALAADGGSSRRQAAKAAGSKGGRASAEVRRGANLAAQDVASSGDDSRGANLAAQESNVRGDIPSTPGVTNDAARGDTGVTQTTQETSLGNLPSSDSLRSSAETGDDEPRSKARKRADAVDLTEQETKTGRDADGNLIAGAKRDKLSVLIARGWWDWVDETPGLSRPAQRFQACQQIIKTALANGHDPYQVKCGLAELSRQARPLTGATLTIAMNSETCNPAAGGNGNGNGNGGRRRGEPDWNRAEQLAREYDAMMAGGQ